jgi:HEAT repeat protein
MFETSSSVMLNLLIITVLMMMLLVASYLLTVLVGDIFFPGPWREQVILGRTPADGRVTVDDHSAEFMIVLIIAVVANAFAINIAADGFLDRYHSEGFFRVRLRAEAPEERLDALEDIADPMNYEIWEIDALQETVVDVFDDPNPEVRQRAYWTAGHMKVLDAQGELIAVLEGDQSPADKQAAAVALAKIDEPKTSRGALEALARRAEDPTVQVGALRGLGLLAQPESIETIIPLTKSDDEEVMTHAYWALREIGNKDARPYVKEVLESNPQGIERCAVYDTMKLVATDEDVTWARREFQRSERKATESKDDCEHVVWTDHDKEQYYIVYGDSFREKLIKIVANTDAFEHREWFQRLVNDPAEPWRIREVANEVLRQIKEEDARR